jgi:ring-1,2-phenylacetyl-CoA epoxidase subunit PaaD
MNPMSKEQILQWLDEVTDPEVPVLTINDLGIVRDVVMTQTDSNNAVEVKITPTYSGCPAMDVIATGIRMVLMVHGIRTVTVTQQLSPAWTTQWMTEAGRQKLQAYGIAPPQYQDKPLALFEEVAVPCPKCGSVHTTMVSQFGATSCKAMYQCNDCKEPFEYFKCH